MSLFFSHPIALFAIPVIMILWYIFGREKMGTIHPNPLIARYLKTPKSIWILWMIRTLMMVSVISLVAGVSVVRTTTTEEPVPQDIMIVFDISLSMLAEDISPNRITVAKSVVRDFILNRTGDRIGLIIFAGKPWVSVPFSTDYSGISSIVSGLSPDLIRQELPGLSGTNIGDALLLANMSHSEQIQSGVSQKQEVQGRKILSQGAYGVVSDGENDFSNEEIRSFSGTHPRSIILLTDGRANIGIDPLISAAESREQNTKIFPVGIGSLSGSELSYTDSWGAKQYFSDGNGGRLRSDLDEPMMRRLAEVTGGEYHHADDRIGLDRVFSRIAATLPVTTESKTKTKQSDLTPILLIGFVILLIIERAHLRYIIRKYRLI